ncbi:MAG: hypothetical protein QM742_07680 [Aquabacterium sp.]
MQCLQLRHPDGAKHEDAWQAFVIDMPEAMGRVRVRVEAVRVGARRARSEGRARRRRHLRFQPARSPYPALEDALDLVLYDGQSAQAKPGQVYRRYEVVRDAAPQTNAQSLAAFQDEVPPAR